MQRFIINACQKTKKVMGRILFVFISLIFIAGCEKEKQSNNTCKELQAIFLSDDETKIKQAVTEAITSLPSRAHTQDNLIALTSLLAGDCGITTEVRCFGCIKTLPEQSEIRVSVTDGTQFFYKIIDISATSITDETMKFVAMHD